MTPPLPPALAARLRGHSLDAVAIGESRADVYRVHAPSSPHPFFLKVQPRDRFLSLEGEASRLRWLRGRLPVPEVVDFIEADGNDYLLMTALPGADAATAAVGPEALVDLLADALRRCHAVPLAGCPFRSPIDEGITNARAILDAGRVAVDKFDPENLGRDPAELFEEMVSLRPPEDQVVFTHGDFCLPNLIVADGRLSGFIDVGRAGAGDPYCDLALAARSLGRNVGPDGIDRFFHRYGLDQPDSRRLRYFLLLDEFV